MKAIWNILAYIVIVLFLIGGIATIGIYFYNKINDSSDPEKAEFIAKSILSYQLPPKYKLAFGLEMMGVKSAFFERKDRNQRIMLSQLPLGKTITNEEFMEDMWNISKTNDPFFDILNNIKLAMEGISITNIEIKNKGIITLQNGTEVPYIISTYIKDGKNEEGFWGVINFNNSRKTIFIMDIANINKYDFTLTREFMEGIGPPQIADISKCATSALLI